MRGGIFWLWFPFLLPKPLSYSASRLIPQASTTGAICVSFSNQQMEWLASWRWLTPTAPRFSGLPRAPTTLPEWTFLGVTGPDFWDEAGRGGRVHQLNWFLAFQHVSILNCGKNSSTLLEVSTISSLCPLPGQNWQELNETTISLYT